MPAKRTIDSFFAPPTRKKVCVEESGPPSTHPTYPFPVSQLPASIVNCLDAVTAPKSHIPFHRPDLDLLLFKQFIPFNVHQTLFEFLRENLFFYRVIYSTNRSGQQAEVRTPRYTTVFGVDASATFSPAGHLLDATTGTPVPSSRWHCQPRPLPQCLDFLRQYSERTTSATFNFCLVNFYADGSDSISYHSDDEGFLGENPTIASLSLGATRDFLMKHKSIKKGMTGDPGANAGADKSQPIKVAMNAGDMLLMQGPTQHNWLHSIPKRKSNAAPGGRINITLRKGVKRYATENYMHYNVGKGPVYRWDAQAKEMRLWQTV